MSAPSADRERRLPLPRGRAAAIAWVLGAQLGCAAAPPCPPASPPPPIARLALPVATDERPSAPCPRTRSAEPGDEAPGDVDAAFESAARESPEHVGWASLRERLVSSAAADSDDVRAMRTLFRAELTVSAELGVEETYARHAVLVSEAREIATTIAACGASPEHTDAAHLLLGEIQLATHRVHAAIASFREATSSTNPALAARARYRAAFAELTMATIENAPQGVGGDDTALFLRTVAPDVHGLRNACMDAEGSDDPVLRRGCDAAPHDAAALLATRASDASAVFAQVVASFELDAERSHALAVALAGDEDEGESYGASHALAFLFHVHAFDARDAAGCDARTVEFVRSLVCRTRDDVDDEAATYLSTCAPSEPLRCAPDAVADMAVARRVLGASREAMRACASGDREPERRPRAPVLRIAGDERGRLAVHVVEPSSDRRAQACVNHALAGLDLSDVHAILGGPVLFQLWDDGHDGSSHPILGRPAIRLDEARIEGRGSAPRGVMSIAIDDDVFATATPPPP